MKWTDEQLEEYTRDAVYLRHSTKKFCYSDDIAEYMRMGIGNVLRERTQRIGVTWSDDGLDFEMFDEFGLSVRLKAWEDKSLMTISVMDTVNTVHEVHVCPRRDFNAGASITRVGQTILDMMEEFGLMSMARATMSRVDERLSAAKREEIKRDAMKSRV